MKEEIALEAKRPSSTRRAIRKLERRAQEKLHHIIIKLTDEARVIEESVFANGWIGMRKKADASSSYYHHAIGNIAQSLRNISIDLFRSVEMESVRVYGLEEELPRRFQQYFYASQHLANVVTEDILSAPSLAMAYMRIERWVALLKLTHEGHDYFSANMIMLALASAPVAQSGLEASLTKTAKAVLVYFQNKYIDHEFMFSLQAHRLALQEEFIPFLPVIARGLGFIQEDVSRANFSEQWIKDVIEERQKPYYTHLGILKDKLLDNKLTRKEALIVHELRKEPLLSFQKLFQSRSASWMYRKRRERLKVSLTMASLQAFDQSDRFYLAKQIIEAEVKALQALGESAELIHTRVVIIIRDTKKNEKKKYKLLRACYRQNANEMIKEAKHLLMNIIRSYADILYFDEKANNLEPRFKKRILVERAESFSSELSTEIPEPVQNFPKKFSFIYQKERELGLKADSPVLQRRMTRENLGFFEGKNSRLKRQMSSWELERKLSAS